MGKYLIHTCNKRLWYVEHFLIPSMLEQGIEESNIEIYNDLHGDGQLRSLIKSLDFTCGRDTWHLQDDIIISSRFKELTEKYDNGIVCGFCNSFSTYQPGRTNVFSMWYSMPCIRIPSGIFRHFISWLQEPETVKRFRHYFLENKHDDVFFENFLKENYPTLSVYNVAPNLVNHIDHLIGGSLINQDRRKEPTELMSTYWDEPELLIDIKNKLQERRIAV